MENAQKAIMIGVGLFITIISIAAVMLITGLGQNITVKIAGVQVTTPTDVNSKIDSTKSYKVSVTGGGATATVTFTAI